MGTPRIITDQNGVVVARRDMMPFGEDITANIGTRNTPSFKYGSTDDDVRQKFTGYQKDEETGLDFAEARMYENRHARFTAVDPLLASGNSSNPQTFNRFVYVGNNPINITDPLGLEWYFSQQNNNYRWFDDKADAGYEKVDFGGSMSFTYTACVVDDCSVTALHRLWDDGSNAWDLDSLISSFTMIQGVDGFRQFDNDLKTGGGIGGRNFLRSIPNCIVECNFLGSPFDPPQIGDVPSLPAGLSLSKLGVPSFFDYEEPTNTTQAVASGFTQITLGALTTKGAGTASRFSFASRSSFAERLFHSKIFGKESKLFGNSTFDSTGNGQQGLLNRTGSLLKIGWSKDRKDLLSVTNMEDWGSVFRIGRGVGSRSNIADKHYYFPNTYLPESYTNKFIFRAPKKK